MKKLLLSLLSVSFLSAYAIDPSGARVDFNGYGSSSSEGVLFLLLIAIIVFAGFCLYAYIKSPKSPKETPKRPVKSEYEIMQERLEREEKEMKGCKIGCLVNLIFWGIIFINATGRTIDGFFSGLMDLIPIAIGFLVIFAIFWIKNEYF
jgi:hypothetical protein